MTIRITEVTVDDARAVALRRILEEDLTERYRSQNAGELPETAVARAEALSVHPDEIVATWLALDEDDTPLGHVMLRRRGDEWELKRLVVPASSRRRGVGSALTNTVVDAARAGGAHRVILQTGLPQPESVALYTAAGFMPIAVYEPYRATMPNSLCFELRLDD